ncbi:MAG: PAS-domain containing protein, partial [Alphaproteobacteria bacterium]|nr:PAS-domain containing protein [Alphaproteobacteria bacterium]
MKSTKATRTRAPAATGGGAPDLVRFLDGSRFLETASGAEVFDFIEDMPIGVSLYDQNDRLVRCNRKALQLAGKNAAAYIAGRTFEEILGDAVRVGMVPAAAGREDEYIANRLALHRDPGSPFEFKADDRWVQVNEHVVKGVGSITFHTDITDQKSVQAALERSEQRFRDYAESASDWLWEIDRELRFVYHSSPNQVEGQPKGHFVSPVGQTRWGMAGVEDPQNHPAWAAHFATLEAKRPFRDFRYTIDNGDAPVQHFRLNGRPIYDEDGTFVGYRGTTTIETEAVEEAKRLRLRQRQLSEAIDQVLVGVALYDENDRLISRNNLERDFGSLSHIVQPGARFEDLVRGSVAAGLFPDAVGREEEFIRDRMDRHRNPRGPFEYRRADRWLVVRENRLANGHTMVVFTDISDIKRAEEALRESEGKFRSLVEGSLQGVC